MVELYASDICWHLDPLPDEPSGEEPVVDALIDAIAWRTLAQETLHGLAVVVREHDQLERRYHRLLGERRSSLTTGSVGVSA